MKLLVLACGSGIATSTVVEQKLTSFLNDQGLAGAYRIEKCAIAEALSHCKQADLLVATTTAPADISCPFVSGVPFLTGVGLDDVKAQIMKVFNDVC